MVYCEWLPDLISIRDYPNMDAYDDEVYEVFKRDFIDSQPNLAGTIVKIKDRPYHDGKEEAYFHLTSKDYYHGPNRSVDILRCERIAWVRKFIENYDCNKPICRECSGMKMWSKPYKKTVRIIILLEEERYVVVLERRKDYYLLITAYYVDQNRRLEALVDEYNKTKSASN